ncbi:protein disulfide-isomerase A4-like [Wyeomyia smithii]|uniref:protein disulfide-isomerase A4-like n=1 Tax=Wyeomyia smithii TaxID=174621 RepID=UPI002467B7D0|nr:protein disulfide-isomerase A4-like [Wyeomyia smithii]
MKWILVAIFAVSLVQSHASELSPEHGILALTPDTFESALQRYPFLMVEFYAPWCKHCQALAPKYANAAKQLAATSSPIKLAVIDAYRYSDFVRPYGVLGYPTLRFFRHGIPTEYKGQHTETALVEWLLQQVPVTESQNSPDDPFPRLTRRNFNSTLRDNPLVAVEFYSPHCPHCKTLAPIFLDVAKELALRNPNVSFAKVDITKEQELAQHQAVINYPVIRLYRNRKPLTYEGSQDQNSIVTWLLSHAEQPIARVGKREPRAALRQDEETNSTCQRMPSILINLLLLVFISAVLSQA